MGWDGIGLESITSKNPMVSVFDSDEPLYARKKIRAVCVGAGMSGLGLAHKLQVEHHATTDYPEGWVDYQIYEKNDDIGGTWYENTYPGVACDVPSHVYVFPFESNPTWSRYFSSGGEIQEYIKRTTKKYDLDRHVQLQSKVIETSWDDDEAVWRIKVQKKDGTVFEDYAHVLINGAGILNKWKWPDIEGLNDFKGDLFHTAKWDHSVDLKDKRILLIGNGSSAIQVLPNIQPLASKIYNVIRNPTWVQPRNGVDLYNENHDYTPEERKKFEEDPSIIAEFQRKVNEDYDAITYCFLKVTPGHDKLQEEYAKVMAERLGNKPDLVKKFVPTYSAGCRRLTPGFGYLEALQKPNVEPMFAKIDKITPTGAVITDENGQRDIEVDIVICATGFDVTFKPFWEINGQKSISLEQKWKKEVPKAYFSICVPDLPNYFVYNGPGFPAMHGTIPKALHAETEYIYLWLDKMSQDRIKYITPKHKLVEQQYHFFQHRLKSTVFASHCSSWYKKSPSEGGAIVAMYPGTMTHFEKVLSTLRPEDFDIEYDYPDHVFYFLGNGQTAEEVAKPNPYL